MNNAAHRRVAVLTGHLQEADAACSSECVERNVTSAEMEAYSVALPEHLTADDPWLVHRSTFSPERLRSHYEAPFEHVNTLYDNWESSVELYPEVEFLGQRPIAANGTPGPYQWMTYAEAGKVRTAIGAGLLHYGVQTGDTVGLYSINCRDWMLVDGACYAYSLVTVPLYDTLGPDAVRFICSHAELTAVACSAECLETLLPCLADTHTVQLVVVFGLKAGTKAPVAPAGARVQIRTLEEVIAAGKSQPRPHMPPAPEDMATICYTSGTTGVPKGAVLTHANMIANSAGTMFVIPLKVGDRHISYLPLAHIYERISVVTAVHCGCSVGFYRGDVLQLLEDVQELQPTIFPSVPRLYNRIYDKVMQAVREGSTVSRKLFETGYACKKAALQRGDLSGGRFGPFWDQLVFSKVKARLGGHVRLMTTGASPISEEVFDFLRICFGATVLEGYGMTETSCVISMTLPGDATAGHVGGPCSSCEIKLVDIPEMSYTNADQPNPRGEICIRGPIVFKGYYKDDKQTQEVLDADGWFHTGDVGTWLPGGRLKIIDRKKSLFKLAQGEYIAPEKLENVYSRSPLVAQAFVYGNSLRAQLVAVLVPDPDTLFPWAASRGLQKDMGALCRNAAVNAAVLASLQEEGRTAKLRGFEQVAAVHLVPEAFSVENGLLTPTFKLKRPQAQATFQDAIATMYARLHE